MPSNKASQDNRANQLNPGHPLYYRSRGDSPEVAERNAADSKAARDNRANQLNPNNEEHPSFEG